MVTEKEILELKKSAGELRDKVIQAKATMTEVLANIEDYNVELKSLGIKNVDDVDIEIAKMKEVIEKTYNEAYEKIQKYL